MHKARTACTVHPTYSIRALRSRWQALSAAARKPLSLSECGTQPRTRGRASALHRTRGARCAAALAVALQSATDARPSCTLPRSCAGRVVCVCRHAARLHVVGEGKRPAVVRHELPVHLLVELHRPFTIHAAGLYALCCVSYVVRCTTVQLCTTAALPCHQAVRR